MERIEPVGPEIRDPSARIVPEPPVGAEEAPPVEGNGGGRPQVEAPMEARRWIGVRCPAYPVGIDVLEIPDPNVADLAEGAALDDRLHLPVMGCGAVLGPVLNDALRPLRRLHDGPALLDVVGEGLLDVGVLPGLACRDGEDAVPVIGRRHQDRVDVLLIENRTEILELARPFAGRVSRLRYLL